MTQGSEKEREEFEAWARSCGFYLGRDPISGEYTDAGSSDAYKGWQAARRANTAQVPEGWKLVPECPTMEMSEAGDDVFREYALNVFSCYTIYTRMIAAAPKPPEAAKDKPVDAVLQMILEQKSKKDALIAKSICPECEGKGECGGQFTGGEWTCEECNGTGKAHGIGSKDT